MVYETFCKNLFKKTTKTICYGLKESIGIIKFKVGGLEMASSKDYLEFVLEQLNKADRLAKGNVEKFKRYY